MAQTTGDQLTDSPASISPNDAQSGTIMIDEPRRSRGTKRLLQSLQRISSSPSLVKLSRAVPSSSYRSGGKGSISCISLSSAGQSSTSHSHSNSYSSELSADFSTAPTSIAGTPGFGNSTTQLGRPSIRILDAQATPNLFYTPARVALPSDFKLLPRSPPLENLQEDYFSSHGTQSDSIDQTFLRAADFNFWRDLPSELRLHVFQYLKHQELVKCSAVSKLWHKMCFDGQLWQELSTADFYTKITRHQLAAIIHKAGPFVKHLEVRGCKQLEEEWLNGLSTACTNLEAVNLRECNIQRNSLKLLVAHNRNLVHMDLVGCCGVTNTTCRMLAEHCPNVQYLDLSFCENVCGKGVFRVIDECHKLRALKVAEVRGMSDANIMLRLFELNTLEQLDCRRCDLSDAAVQTLFEGSNAEFDVLTGQAVVPPRRLRQLDLSFCSSLTDRALRAIFGHVPDLRNLQLSACVLLTDSALMDLFCTTPFLSTLNVDGVRLLTNATLQALTRAPCIKSLAWLTISDCEHLSDAGMMGIFKAADNLQTVHMDNTRIGDLTLIEAATAARGRVCSTISTNSRPFKALRLEVFDCQNVTWNGVRGVMARNAEITGPLANTNATGSSCPKGFVSLHCFYGWQQTVDEHEKRVLRGDLAAASRLEKKWAQYMVAYEEAGIPGSGGRRRRRRMREAAQQHDEEEGGTGVIGRRRRARSGGCIVM
ncbi:MAG: hypothetical protein M1814_002869 [Vezdaea aestivalis]|nr:MAG: hypothetical protein M1814_002869 [Vezdaea aestivalis]